MWVGVHSSSLLVLPLKLNNVDNDNESENDGDDDDDSATMGDDLVETIVGDKEGMVDRNKFGPSVGKPVVLITALVGKELSLLTTLTLSSVGNE